MKATHAVTGMWTKYLAVTLVALALGLSAQTGAAAEATGPCAADVAKFCSDVRPGGGRIARCLKANKSELTQACKDGIAEVGEKVREAGEKAREAQATGPCAEDVAKFCSDVRPGRGRIARCLKANKSELTQSCKDGIAEVGEKVGEVRSACEDDTFKFCRNIRSGRGRLLRCLKRHEGELSEACNAKVGQAKTDEQL